MNKKYIKSKYSKKLIKEYQLELELKNIILNNKEEYEKILNNIEEYEKIINKVFNDYFEYYHVKKQIYLSKFNYSWATQLIEYYFEYDYLLHFIKDVIKMDMKEIIEYLNGHIYFINDKKFLNKIDIIWEYYYERKYYHLIYEELDNGFSEIRDKIDKKNRIILYNFDVFYNLNFIFDFENNKRKRE